MNIKTLSKQYEVRKLNENNIEEILKLYNSNPLYFQYCPPLPTIESVKNDLIDIPPNKSFKDKLFLGFYHQDKLISILDLILKYPDDKTCFIGLFMVDSSYANKNIGTNIINDLCLNLSKDYDHIRLAWIIDNPQAKHFWLKNKFIPIKQTISNTNMQVTLAIRDLK